MNMRKLLHLFFILVWTTFGLYAQVINQTSFENFNDEHEFLQSDWSSEGFNPAWVNGFNQSRVYVDDAQAQSGNKSLRVEYPSGGVGPASSGAQAPLQVSPQNELYMSYWVRFSDDFDWGGSNEGGKLPGLAGGGRCSGCSNCNGSNGFSARLMWRSGGRAVLYLYHMNKTNTCGDNDNLLDGNGDPIYLQKGEWYHIAQRVKINSGNNADGEVEVWVNGVEAITRTGLQFVSNGDQVDVLYFSTFHGGSGGSWAPGNTCYTWFDDVIIGQSWDDVVGGICSDPNLGEDQTICGLGSITLDSQLDPADRTFTWYRNGVNQNSNAPTLTVSQAGEYVVSADFDGCIKSDTIVISGELLSPELGDQKAFVTGGDVLLTSGLDAGQLNFQWSRNGSPISGAMDNTYTANQCGNYSVTVSASGCASKSDDVDVIEVPLPITSASGDDGNVASNTVDGDLVTRWSSQGDGEWVQFDLGQNMDIDGVNISFFKGNERQTIFDVAISTNGINFTNIITDQYSSGTSTDMESFSFAASTARYVRNIGHGNTSNDWNSIQEVSFSYLSSLCADTPDDATLSSITTDVGTLSPTFEPSVLNYTVLVADGNPVPQISAIANSSEATVAINQATSLSGTATITVTAEDGITTQTYQVDITTYTPQATSVAITPGSTDIQTGESASFSASVLDQNGNAMTGTINWSISGGGTINNSTGSTTTFQSNGTGGTYTLTATSGSASDNATSVVNDCPAVAVPNANDWIVRNQWSDQGNGSGFMTNATDMSFIHRQWGKADIYLINSGVMQTVENGKEYTVSFEYKDDADNPIQSIEVGFSDDWSNHSVTTYQAALTDANVNVNANDFSMVEVDLTATADGDTYLVLYVVWADQPNQEYTGYIKNVAVCEKSNNTVVDSDNDGTPDHEDACPNDPNKAVDAGQCGCGIADTDTDGDGTADCNDAFPNDFDNDGVATSDDCDDADAGVGAATTWYADTDGDGSGDANNTVEDCTQPSGYVATAGDECPNDQNKASLGACGCGVADTDTDGDGTADCNDAFPNDFDNDGVATSDDCDDADEGVGAVTTWYADADGDGSGDANNTVEDCTQPPGYVATAGDECPNDQNKTNPGICGCGTEDVDVDNDGECDNTDSDLDNDGVDNADDCEPTNPNVGAATTWYEDRDNDGLGNVAVSLQACSQPSGYVSNSMDTNDDDFDNDGVATSDDCDDADAGVGATTTWYADADNDGSGDANNTVEDCTQPSGYVATAGDECPNDGNKTAPGACGCGVADTDTDGDGTADCNDAFPNDFDNDGVDTSDDCDDADAGVGVATTWYADTDGDGSGDANNTVEDCTQPSGYVATAGDECPDDGKKTAPGTCGCDIEEGMCDDCAGVPNGEAAEDVCGTCTGGTTGITPVTNPEECIATSIESLNQTNIKIYPNPFEKTAIIKADGIHYVKVYGLTGILIFEGQFENELTIGEGWKNGVYLVEVVGSSSQKFFKLIKK